MAEGGGLLNRCRVKSSTGGSNPPLSASESFSFIISHLCRRLSRILGRNREFCVTQRIARDEITTVNRPFFSGAAGRSPVSVRSNNISLRFRHLRYDASPSQTEPALSSLTISRLMVRVRVKLKSLQDWDLDVTAKEIDASDHDSLGWEDKLLGLASWKGTVKGVYFEGGPTPQGIFTSPTAGLVGNGTIACTFYPQLGTVGDGSLSLHRHGGHYRLEARHSDEWRAYHRHHHLGPRRAGDHSAVSSVCGHPEGSRKTPSGST